MIVFVEGLLTLIVILAHAAIPLIVLIVVLRTITHYLESKKIDPDHKLFMSLVGDKIRYNRELNNMAPSFVAESLNVNQRVLLKWEEGLMDIPLSKLVTLSEIFEIDLQDLLG